MQISPHGFAVLGMAYLPPWAVNAGFLMGDERCLVVDTGPNALAAQTLLGYARFAAPGRSLVAVNTEPHFDHIAGNQVFQKAGIPLWSTGKILRSPETQDANAQELQACIPEDFRRKAQEGQIFFRDCGVVNPENFITQETVWNLGNLEVHLLPCPGHTPANLLVWIPQDRLLFAGDTVVEGWLPNTDDRGPEGTSQWLQGLDLIRTLNPEVVVPGHGRVLRGTQELASALNRLEKILEGLPS